MNKKFSYQSWYDKQNSKKSDLLYERLKTQFIGKNLLEEQEQLNEGFTDWLSKFNPFSEEPGEKNSFFNGHLVLDAVALVSSFIPVYGSAVSIGADLLNAVWYFSEGEKFVAGLYVIMAIPGVGDALALPIQAILKGGSAALKKLIPFIPQLYKGRNLIKSFLTRTIVIEEKLGAQGLSKATEEIFEKFFEIYEKEGAEKAGEYFAKNVDKDLIKNGGPAVAKVEKKGMEKAVEKIATKAEKEASTLAGKAMYKGEQNLLKRAIILGTKAAVVGGGEGITPTPGPGVGKGGACRGKGTKECPTDNLSWGCGGLKSGITSDAVKVVQQKLIDCGYPLPKFGVDGRFCTETKGAVTAFQRDAGLPTNGIADAKTIAALENCRDKPTPAPEEEPKEQPKEVLPTDTSIQGRVGYIDVETEGYHIKPIRNRYDNLEKLVFERLVKNAN